MTTMEVEGLFWLPDWPGDQVGGRLVFDPIEGGKLSLIGALDTSRGVSRIIGGSNDGFYTLDDCFVLSEQVSAITRQTFNVGHIFGGVAYDENEEPAFDRFDIGLANLIEWVQPPGMAEDANLGTTPDGRKQRFAVKLDPWEDRQAKVLAGTLSLRQSRGLTGDGLRERTLTQRLFFSLQFDRTLPLSEVLDAASRLQNLVSIGTDRVAAYDYVHLYHDDLYTELPSGKRIPEPARRTCSA